MNLLPNPESEEQYHLDTRSELEQQAKASGRKIVEPLPDQLQIDIDNSEALGFFKQQWNILLQLFPGAKWEATTSRTLGHLHITVSLDGTVLTPVERLSFQAMMGSDRKRELLGVMRMKRGLDPIGFFFEKI